MPSGAKPLAVTVNCKGTISLLLVMIHVTIDSLTFQIMQTTTRWTSCLLDYLNVRKLRRDEWINGQMKRGRKEKCKNPGSALCGATQECYGLRISKSLTYDTSLNKISLTQSKISVSVIAELRRPKAAKQSPIPILGNGREPMK